MKMTQNRLRILELLANPIEGTLPPHSASTIVYGFECELGLSVLKNQIHRTLRDLHKAGLITFEYELNDDTQNRLPQREKLWHIKGAEEQNELARLLGCVAMTIDRHSHGVKLFGDMMLIPMSGKDLDSYTLRLTTALGQHPSRVDDIGNLLEQLAKIKPEK